MSVVLRRLTGRERRRRVVVVIMGVLFFFCGGKWGEVGGGFVSGWGGV